MKITVAAAALALAIGTAASAFAAPPAPTTPAAPAVHATATAPAKSASLKADGTIKTISDKGFTLNGGKAFKFETGVNTSSLKAGQKVKVQYEMKNHQRWATEVTPS